MNRKHLGVPVMLISLVTVLALLPTAVALADEPTAVSFTALRVGPFRNAVREEVGGNLFITRDLTLAWAGDISGTGEAHQTAIFFRNGEYMTVIDVTCACTVEGVSGTFNVRIQGMSDLQDERWQGTWEILGSEGGLAGLQGQGTSYQVPPYPSPLVFEGAVHFEP